MATNTFATSQPPSQLPAFTGSSSSSAASTPGLFKHPYLNGTRTIRGWVRNNSGVPQVRELVLLVEPSMLPLSRKLSDPGAPEETDYEFAGLADLTGTEERYAVVQRPRDYATTAQIRNGLLGF